LTPIVRTETQETFMSDNPVLDAITSRQSIRAFTDQPVSREQVEELLRAARWAPSGSNIQPWKVHVLQGPARDRVVAAVMQAFEADPDCADREYEYYPTDWFEPYIGRRRACGWGLYNAVGVERGDREGMKRQRARNYAFFDAPVGLMFTIEKRLNKGSWMDLGMFLQTLMIAARGLGLDSCAQAAFADYHVAIRGELDIPDSETLVCGMGIGYRVDDAPENLWRTDREDISAFTTWHE
jgi:nitroreductase